MTTANATELIHRHPKNMEEVEAKRVILRKQRMGIIEQGGFDPNRKLVWVECPCGQRLALCQAFKCLYCGLTFCKTCAEVHFAADVTA